MSHVANTVLICPGQGAQRGGGVTDLADARSELADAGQEAFRLASSITGCDLWRLGLSRDPADELALRQPSLLQPYLIAWAVAEHAKVAERIGPLGYITGHSSGMNSAIALSGAVDLETTLSFAWQCGVNMDLDCAERPGGLLALVGAGREAAEAIAVESAGSLANHNAPDQTVVGGSFSALDHASTLVTRHGGQAVPLRVAGAFHTASFDRSDEKNRALIARLPIAEAFTPIIGNRCGQVIDSPQALREELCGQYVRPVEWLSALETLYARGVRRYITLGPGNVMAGLVRRYGKAVSERIQIQRISQLTP